MIRLLFHHHEEEVALEAVVVSQEVAVSEAVVAGMTSEAAVLEAADTSGVVALEAVDTVIFVADSEVAASEVVAVDSEVDFEEITEIFPLENTGVTGETIEEILVASTEEGEVVTIVTCTTMKDSKETLLSVIDHQLGFKNLYQSDNKIEFFSLMNV